ncbi:hypothetical protein OXR01_10750 [Staphylococcus gallinarum]|uniref:YokE-like PH domain-containing protein n=1 Tax=Staphylococcus gallinarum TaxID=1293 RepID=A0A0D0RMN1_STAGA|nr:hypothetical protein [Staphylococcus gallinarum]KIR11252.1 hypothetical protein SH09_08915 [Staphylococcus gallinarum]MBU7217128.1 hypothetical protein [Staphylococcus gallinarum]MCD8785070.1 hypothetical protein [Staphylococcus gallinarum]MCD8792655.1 hypothetical protein [Staphylococcus gallinarum]MCD8829968.1 hypothetical protein [Staphylococcus gallinarum]
MILDKVNPADLFPTEKQGPSVLGNMPYPVNGEVKVFEAAYIATNERLILNVDMAGEFYYRNIGYDEVQAIDVTEGTLNITFSIGTFKMSDMDDKRLADFVTYVKEKIVSK